MQDRIEAGGATFVAISPQTPEKSQELIAARKLSFPILRDEGNALARRFNPLNQVPEDLKSIYLNLASIWEPPTARQAGRCRCPAPT